jgi:hypothetical protein
MTLLPQGFMGIQIQRLQPVKCARCFQQQEITNRDIILAMNGLNRDVPIHLWGKGRRYSRAARIVSSRWPFRSVSTPAASAAGIPVEPSTRTPGWPFVNP